MKVYLHIGGEKTGTTTIQEFCRVNRATLAQMGFLYPSSLGSSNHLKLTAYALGDNDFEDDTRKHFGIRNKWDLEKFRSTVEHDLRQEVEQARDATIAILSNELIQSRLTDLAELTRLSTLLKSCFSEIRILVYLRRQDRVAISHYSTQLKSDSESGSLVFPIISGNDELPPYFDYNRMLNHLEIVFGKSNIEVRLFEIESLKGGDLLTDFRSFCDITERETFEQVERENESLSPSAIAFYKHLNTVVPRFVYDAPNPLRLGLNAAMSKEFAGRGPQVTATAARTFYSNFLPGNREISRRYFSNGDPDLFSGDFSMYREELVEDLEPSELIEIAAHLWLERSVEVERLKLEAYLARFSLAICKLKKPPAPPPSTGVGAHTPGNLAVQWLGRYYTSARTTEQRKPPESCQTRRPCRCIR